ncbi:MAG TPA: GNAT family N-acetyltransferase [Jatrophihabitantaceae bacterium]
MFLIESRPYADPVAAKLIAELQAEYVTRYGGPDETPIEPGEFDPPDGLFLVGSLSGDAVAAGGWRRVGDGVAEIKRMYVAERARRRGLSRRMLTELESTLTAAGYQRVVLMTAMAQPEAIALYESTGYRVAEPYGIYACEPDARFYAKPL